jgi:diguanylate cyclase (GGDEF)-like protein
MADHTELLQAALEIFPEGIVLVGADGQVVLWNHAAEVISGHAAMDMLSRPLPTSLSVLVTGPQSEGQEQGAAVQQLSEGVLAHLEHQLRHDVLVMMRLLVLRDGLGRRIGTATLFHLAENVEGLPHGECATGSSVKKEQSEFETRLKTIYAEFDQGGPSFGVMWITVDQAQEMRKTHGNATCDAMIEKVERVLANGLRTSEELGRWGNDEYMVLSHECTPEALAAHAKVLAGLARTADFEWWGDKVAVTVSVGVAQAERKISLSNLLEKAKAAMLTSYEAGGNQITSVAGV